MQFKARFEAETLWVETLVIAFICLLISFLQGIKVLLWIQKTLVRFSLTTGSAPLEINISSANRAVLVGIFSLGRHSMMQDFS